MPETQTILVVDDRSVDRRLLKKMLESSGYEVEEASDGLEGLEMAKRNKPDLIIADTLMPRMDGFGFLRNIRKNEKTKTIPFILYSAVYTGYADEKLTLSLGANAFIQKPIDTDEFLESVRAAIQGVKAGKETATEELIEEEEEYLRRYSQVVAAKLEEKVRELEATNKDLQRQVVDGLRAEDALHKERDRAQQYLDVAGVALVVIGADRKASLVNQKGCEILGYEKEDEIIDKAWFDNFVPERLRDEITRVFESLMAGEIEPVEYYEHPVLTKDGEERIVAWHNTILRDEDGKIYATLGSGEDVTERRRAEDALRESEEFNSNLLDSSPNPILVINPDTSVRYVNTALERLTGFSSAEIIGRKAPYPWWTEETLQKTGINLDDAMHKEVANLEELFQRKNGERFWVGITSIPARKNGKFKYYLANWIDITKRKRAEDASHQMSNDQETILDSVPAMIFYKDKGDKFLRVNKILADTFGLPKEEIIGKTVPEISPAKKDYWKDDQEIMKSGQPKYNIIEPAKTPEGTLWFQTDKIPYKDNEGNIIGIIGFSIDITERKRAEDALRDSEKQLRETKDYLDNIIESSADAIVVADMDGTVRSWNMAAEEYTGYTADEVIGSSNRKFFADSEEPERLMEMVLRDEELKNYRTTVLTKDKKPVQISLSASLLKDSKGVPIGTVRVSRDITKEVELEARIKEERDNMNLIFDSMVDGIYIVSKDYEIEFMNKVLIDAFGDHVGAICYKAVHNREEPCPLCKNPEVMNGETVQWEWNSGRRNKAYDLIETPLKNIDGTISKLTIFRDITERKLAEEKLEKKVKELRRFNEMTVDRELKMVELKKEINSLLRGLGKEPRYKIPETS